MLVMSAAAVSRSLSLPSLSFPLFVHSLIRQSPPPLLPSSIPGRSLTVCRSPQCALPCPDSMGCSNSSPAGGCKDEGKDMSDDSISQEEKHRNYGGVYVGLATDASSTCRDSKEDEDPSQSKALNTLPGSPLPENVC